uniref:Methionine--tRNA ligase, mitochondrial n=1 Tax=Caenorhabditis japonica TaxID=281687 RepID=A0A8R1IB16_CAEJA
MVMLLTRVLTRNASSFITSPIFYANAEPHIGHAYTAILCDTAHRWNHLKNPGEPAIFSIGTDEHGSKIFRASQANKMSPQLFCDKVSQKFSKLFAELNLSHTDFIRTTSPSHKEAVQHFWSLLEKRGHIYKSTYSGYYSITDECFIPDTDVEQVQMMDGKQPIHVMKDTKTPVEWIEEDNYMFRLSDFRERVTNWITSEDVVRPTKYTPLALNSIEFAEDLSISRSRSRLSWGIPVPNDDTQTIYVWLDALVNYLTVSGYPNLNQSTWPPTCQIIGKDIVKFHLFYWPAFLLAADLPLPKRVFVHGHWLVDNVKMSKSLGNVVNPSEAIQKFTSQGLRYFLLKQGNPSFDSSFSADACLETINSDLVNNVGNLLNRSTVSKINGKGTYPSLQLDQLDPKVSEDSKKLVTMLDNVKNICEELYSEMMYYKVIEELMLTMKEANRVFQCSEPWKEKDEKKLESVIFITYESLRIVSILFQPILPEMSLFCLDRLGVPLEERKLENASIGMFAGGKIEQDQRVFIERLQK